MAGDRVTETIYLHIGTEKTGTTTLQVTARVNHDRLKQAGIFYPFTAGERPQQRLALFASDAPTTDNLRSLAGLSGAADYAAFRANFAEELRADIAANGCPKVLLSSEHLSSRVRRPDDMARLAATLRSLAHHVIVIVYLRPQYDLCLSTYSTSVKSGAVHAFESPANAQVYYFNYDMMLSRWANAFGEKNMVVRIFDRQEFAGGDLLQDFLTILGVPPDAGIVPSRPLNPSLDMETVEFLRQLNAYLPRMKGDVLDPERDDIVAAIEAISDGPKLRLPEATRRGIIEMFAASNAAVARRFLGRADGRLFAEPPLLPEIQASTLSVERSIAIAAHLWRWKQRQKLALKRPRTGL